GFNTGFFRSTTFHDIENIQTLDIINLIFFTDTFVNLAETHSYITPLHGTEFFKVVYNLFHQINRNSKSVSGINTGRRSNSGIDTNQLTPGIHQGTTAISFVNHCICLDKRLYRSPHDGFLGLSITVRRTLSLLPENTDLTAFRTYNTRRNRRL